jgi:tricorn protease interacting factor F2/3
MVKRTLDFTLSEEVKRQDVRTVLLAATEKPDAKNVTWKWMQDNIEKLRKLYENTGILSGTFLYVIPILGIGRVKEVEAFFNTHKITDADVGVNAGLEKLKAYDRLVRSIA